MIIIWEDMQVPAFKGGIVDRQIGRSFHCWKKDSGLHYQVLWKLDDLLLFRFLYAFYRSFFGLCSFPKFPIRRTCPRSHQIAGREIRIGGGRGIRDYCLNCVIVIIIGSGICVQCIDITLVNIRGMGCVHWQRLCVFIDLCGLKSVSMDGDAWRFERHFCFGENGNRRHFVIQLHVIIF